MSRGSDPTKESYLKKPAKNDGTNRFGQKGLVSKLWPLEIGNHQKRSPFSPFFKFYEKLMPPG